MTKPNRLILLSLTGVLLAVVAGCKKNPPTTTAKEAPPPAVATQPTPPEPSSPAAPPAPKVEGNVLAEDISTLNSRGYLKDAFFDFDKADLRDDARAALSADAQWLKRYGSIQVLVEGHCDERGTEEYNLSLGQRRASAAKEYLVSLGIEAGRINTVSYGKTRPFCGDSNESCWQQNRRGHFVITAK